MSDPGDDYSPLKKTVLIVVMAAGAWFIVWTLVGALIGLISLFWA